MYFLDLLLDKKCKMDLFNRAGPAELIWRTVDTWRSHVSPCGRLRGRLHGHLNSGLADDGATG